MMYQVKSRVAHDKPWLTPRAHYILIDPDRVREYGYETARGETYRPPTPHSRRGHWRRLPVGFSKARTWVRPAWVGQTQWQSEGQVYNILVREEAH